MHGAVEVMLGPAVGDEGAVHLRGGHVQFVLLEEEKKKKSCDQLSLSLPAVSSLKHRMTLQWEEPQRTMRNLYKYTFEQRVRGQLRDSVSCSGTCGQRMEFLMKRSIVMSE